MSEISLKVIEKVLQTKAKRIKPSLERIMKRAVRKAKLKMNREFKKALKFALLNADIKNAELEPDELDHWIHEIIREDLDISIPNATDWGIDIR